MKIIVTEHDMRPTSQKEWEAGAEVLLTTEDFYLSIHNIKSADSIVFESVIRPWSMTLK